MIFPKHRIWKFLSHWTLHWVLAEERLKPWLLSMVPWDSHCWSPSDLRFQIGLPHSEPSMSFNFSEIWTQVDFVKEYSSPILPASKFYSFFKTQPRTLFRTSLTRQLQVILALSCCSVSSIRTVQLPPGMTVAHYPTSCSYGRMVGKGQRCHECFCSLTLPRGMWNLSSPTRESNPCPLQWKHEVSTTELPGESQDIPGWLLTCQLDAGNQRLHTLSPVFGIHSSPTIRTLGAISKTVPWGDEMLLRPSGWYIHD